jgi:hypothetical protein
LVGILNNYASRNPPNAVRRPVGCTLQRTLKNIRELVGANV